MRSPSSQLRSTLRSVTSLHAALLQNFPMIEYVRSEEMMAKDESESQENSAASEESQDFIWESNE